MPTSKQDVGLLKVYFSANLVYAGIFSSTTGLLNPLVDIYKGGNISLVLPNKIQVSFDGSGYSESLCSMQVITLF